MWKTNIQILCPYSVLFTTYIQNVEVLSKKSPSKFQTFSLTACMYCFWNSNQFRPPSDSNRTTGRYEQLHSSPTPRIAFRKPRSTWKKTFSHPSQLQKTPQETLQRKKTPGKALEMTHIKYIFSPRSKQVKWFCDHLHPTILSCVCAHLEFPGWQTLANACPTLTFRRTFSEELQLRPRGTGPN